MKSLFVGSNCCYGFLEAMSIRLFYFLNPFGDGDETVVADVIKLVQERGLVQMQECINWLSSNQRSLFSSRYQISEVDKQDPLIKKISETQKSVNGWPIPPLALVDTRVWKKGKIVGKYGTARIFPDEVLLEPHKIIFSLKPPNIQKTEDGKTVLQQQATRGCTAACAMMLCADHGKEIDWDKMSSTNLGNTDDMVDALKKADLKPKVTTIARDETTDSRIQIMRNLILKHGSAIVDISCSAGGHVVILDDIDETFTKVLVREPYHGCQALVKIEWLRNVSSYQQDIIQVENRHHL